MRAITSLMTGAAYKTSAEMARELGPFPRYDAERARRWSACCATIAAPHIMRRSSEYEGLTVHAGHARTDALHARDVGAGARRCGINALAIGEVAGYRNAQVTVIAPTGTIGLVMDCDTTGIEPDFALVKFKKLAGGGYFKIVNQSVEPALQQLGYTHEQIAGDRDVRKGHEHARRRSAHQSCDAQSERL